MRALVGGGQMWAFIAILGIMIGVGYCLHNDPASRPVRRADAGADR